MKAQVAPLPLDLKHVFRIAHGASTRRTNALLRLGTGFGEAALPPYYPTSLEDVSDWIASQSDWIEDVIIQKDIPISSHLDRVPDGPSPAIAALDMALHDIWGQRLGSPLYKLFGLDPQHIPVSSYALPIPADLDELDAFLEGARGFPFLKLKIGSGNTDFDEAIVRRTRERFSGRLCVDVNSGWTIDTAVSMIQRLSKCDLDFVEQPIPSDDIDDWHLLRRLLPSESPKLIADESVQDENDIIALAGAADGINIKLAKCGGLHPARKMIAVARSLDLSVMLGCMIESSVALTAAAHIAALVDFLDLDGQMHLAADPFTGIGFDRGWITLPDLPGLGVSPVIDLMSL